MTQKTFKNRVMVRLRVIRCAKSKDKKTQALIGLILEMGPEGGERYRLLLKRYAESVVDERLYRRVNIGPDLV